MSVNTTFNSCAMQGPFFTQASGGGVENERDKAVSNEQKIDSLASTIHAPNFTENRSLYKRVSFLCKITINTLKIIRSALYAFASYVFNCFISGVKELTHAVLYKKNHRSCNGLIITDHVVDPSKEKYELHKGLMTDIACRNRGEKSEETTAFLAANFLGKNAPTQIDILNKLVPEVEKKYDTGRRCDYTYHRYGFVDNLEIGQKVNEKVFALAKESPFIPTDTTEFSQLYPLVFQQAVGMDFPTEELFLHFEKYQQDSLSKEIEKPILFDLSDRISSKMSILSEAAARDELSKIKKEFQGSLELLASSLEEKYPQHSKSAIKKWIKSSTLFVCRVKDPSSEICGVKVLPVVCEESKGKYIENHPSLVNFISSCGLFVTSVNLRRYLWTRPLDGKSCSLYNTFKGNDKPFANIFRNEEGKFLADRFIQDIEAIFRKSFDSSSHYGALGFGTIQLINGLLETISDEKWSELASDKVKYEIIQASFYSILVELASARQQMEVNDFDLFSQKIELVHAHLADLLEVVRPFTKEDYEKNYLQMTGNIPGITIDEKGDPTNYVRAGICKTGMNAFTAITSAIHTKADKPVRAYGKGFYFEQAGFIGYDNDLETILDDDSIESLDLFACQFFPNIEVASDFTHYEKGKVAEDIRRIFEKKPKTKELTVAVDCTINDLDSEENEMKRLLQEFKKEIAEGKIQFVFFRSGQKLDQFGMDSYYGAPFVQVNNRDEKWKPFDNIHTDKPFQTDILSLQWFTLAFTSAASSMQLYREKIFQNSREIISKLPEKLKPAEDVKKQKIRVNTFSDDMLPTFIDIKLSGNNHRLRAHWMLAHFYEKFNEKGCKINTRASFGFIQPNFIVININEIPDSTTIRLNPGINPEHNDFIAELIMGCVESDEPS